MFPPLPFFILFPWPFWSFFWSRFLLQPFADSHDLQPLLFCSPLVRAPQPFFFLQLLRSAAMFFLVCSLPEPFSAADICQVACRCSPFPVAHFHVFLCRPCSHLLFFPQPFRAFSCCSLFVAELFLLILVGLATVFTVLYKLSPALNQSSVWFPALDWYSFQLSTTCFAVFGMFSEACCVVLPGPCCYFAVVVV